MQLEAFLPSKAIGLDAEFTRILLELAPANIVAYGFLQDWPRPEKFCDIEVEPRFLDNIATELPLPMGKVLKLDA